MSMLDALRGTPHIMLDLETLDVTHTAAIVAIGAVVFDVDGRYQTTSSKFYQPIEVASAMKYGTVSADTLLWWLKQSKEAIDSTFFNTYTDPCFTHIALERFERWCHNFYVGKESPCIWGNGADFDNVIIKHAFDRCKMKQFWGRNNRCYRTVSSLFPEIPREDNRTGVKHNALDDAITQAEHLVKIFKHMRETGKEEA